jgi:DNA invertase Pin-like site-specific DNA recombinase
MEDENIENQKMAIEDFAKKNGFELLGIFEDVGVSGGKPALERDGFVTMLKASEQLGVKTIIIFDISRLGRDFLDVILTLKYLEEKEFKVYFVNNPELNDVNQYKDSIVGSVIRKFLIAILGFFAEMERAMIRERTKVALERAKRQGRPPGRPGLKIDCKEVQKMVERGITRPSDICLIFKAQGKLTIKGRNKEVEASLVTCSKKVKQCIKKLRQS